MSKKLVAVIGAGGAGLAMCRYLTNESNIDFVVFEKAHEIGGIWRYTKGGGELEKNEEHGTAMYKNLRTNLPKEVMAYPDLPFPQGLPSFVTHTDVMQYLRSYVEHFDLGKYINFSHQVLSVKPRNDKQGVWEVVVKDLTNNTIHEDVFDAVVVCNGHFSVPRFPEILGLDTFPGTVLHSFYFDCPEKYKDKRVVVLGAGSSGLDITMALSQYARKVFVVHRRLNKLPSKFPVHVEQVLGTITACSKDGSVEINNKQLLPSVDVIILCTGYNRAFPFLNDECGIKVTNNRVTSLYKHIFSTKCPSLSFIGLCMRICPFPHFASQAQCIASVISGRTILPSQDEMVKEEELDYRERLKQGLGEDMMHLLGAERMSAYYKTMADMAGVATCLSPAAQSLYVHLAKVRVLELATYKRKNFTIIGNEWQEVESGN